MANERWTKKRFLKYIKKNALFAETNQILNIDELSEEMALSERYLERRICESRKKGELPKIDMTRQFDSFRKYYSKTDDERIIYLRQQGTSYKEIADLLGRSAKSIGTRIEALRKSGQLKCPGHWEEWEIDAVRKNVTFDEHGFVNNYQELLHLLQGRRSKKALEVKISLLRSKNRIETKPKPGTTNIRSIKNFREFNEISFASLNYKKRNIIYMHQTKKAYLGSRRDKQIKNGIQAHFSMSGRRKL